MKQCVSFLLAINFCAVLQAQVKWDGEGNDGLWSTAANWVGDLVPAASDQVVLDNSIIPGNYTVSLPAGNISVVVQSLTITPAAGNTITFINPVSNTSPTAFIADGAGDAIILNAGAVFLNASGAAGGTPVSVVSTNFFRINNGGRYIHRTARQHTNFLASRLSTEPGTEQGIFEFDVPGTASYTVSGSGRTYGTLIFSATAAGGVRTYTTAGTMPMQVNHNLVLNANAVFSYGANTSTIAIHNNLEVKTGGLFNISNSSNNAIIAVKGNLINEGLITETGTSTASTIELNGNAPQTISGIGSIVQSITISINNDKGVSLLSPFSIAHRLRLINGKLITSISSRLFINDNASCTDASAASFVDGPMTKTGDDDFIFPIGKGGIYAPIGISGTGGQVTDQFTAEYIRANPHSAVGLGGNVQPSMHHVSYVEYWKLTCDAGVSDKVIKMFVTPESFVRNLTTMRVARFESGLWKDEGGVTYNTGVSVPPYTTGDFTSANSVTAFGAFTLGTTDTETINPLPVTLLDFRALMITDRTIELKWKISEMDGVVRFSIQRAGSDQRYLPVRDFNSNDRINEYAIDDNDPLPGANYYRLVISDSAGREWISQARTVIVPPINTTFIRSITAKTDLLVIDTQSDKQTQIELQVLNITGALVQKHSKVLLAGKSTINIATPLAKGMYLIYGITKEGRTNVYRVVVR